MAKIVRYEFVGSWAAFWLLCITVVGIPVALLYVLNGTVRVEDDLDDPELFLSQYRSGKFKK